MGDGEAAARAVCAEAEKCGVRTLLLRCDVSDDAGVRAMLKAVQDGFGRLDVLINNAGTTSTVEPRDFEAMTVEEAVRKMTSVPATAWGFADRGVVAEGKAADLNIFDLATITPDLPELVYDLPGGARRLRQTASGFLATIVNGEVFMDHGEHVGALAGRVVRSTD